MKKGSIILKCKNLDIIKNAFEGIEISAFWVTPGRSIKLEYNEKDTDKVVGKLNLALQEDDSVTYHIENKVFRATKEDGQIVIDEMQVFYFPKNRKKFRQELENLLALMDEGLI